MSTSSRNRYAAYGRVDQRDSYWKLTVFCTLSEKDVSNKWKTLSRPIFPHITICQHTEATLPSTVSGTQFNIVKMLIESFKEKIKTVTLTLVDNETSKYQLVTVCKEIQELRSEIAKHLNTTHTSSIDDESIKEGHITAKLSLQDDILKSKKLVLNTSKIIVSVSLAPLNSNVKLFNCIYERDGNKNKIANMIAKANETITSKNYSDCIGNRADYKKIIEKAFDDINELTTTENMNENKKHNNDNEIQSSNKKQKL